MFFACATEGLVEGVSELMNCDVINSPYIAEIGEPLNTGSSKEFLGRNGIAGPISVPSSRRSAVSK